MSIPFRALPFPGSQQVVMGFKVARFLNRTTDGTVIISFTYTGVGTITY